MTRTAGTRKRIYTPPSNGYDRAVLELAQRLRLQREELTGYRDHFQQLPDDFGEKVTALVVAREDLIAALEAEYRKNWRGGK